MKKIILISALALSMSSASVAMASLSSDIQSSGMCKAVGSAVSSGATVSSIIAQAATMSQADQKTLLTALYAAGANDDAIRISAEKAKISDLVLVEAFNANSSQGCVDDRSIAQNAPTPAAPPLAETAATTGQTAQQAAPAGEEAAAATAPEEGSADWAIEAGGRSMMLGEYWTTFYENYKKIGIDETAILAIKEGILPDAFMEGGLALEDLNPQNLIKAMYCAGYKGDDIKKACDQFEISELVLIAGFKKSKEECSDQVTDTQAYTQAAGPSMAGVPSPGSGGSSYASPSTF
ncbi:MAG: hypothetical protein LBU39_07410 [Desulfobulbaceae bacterium]|jgi:hypothetical protein|nr:hypothetical protein [Desulfobulbaceae bacterium]